MSTSKAISKVTNMMSEKRSGEQRLPDGDAPDDHHEAGDQQEARHVEPEPLGEQAEQQGRDEYLHHAAKLLARDEGSARLLADEKLLGETQRLAAARMTRDRTGSTRLRPVASHPMPVRQLSNPSSPANASSSSETATSTARLLVTPASRSPARRDPRRRFRLRILPLSSRRSPLRS